MNHLYKFKGSINYFKQWNRSLSSQHHLIPHMIPNSFNKKETWNHGTTHQVINQVELCKDINLYHTDKALKDAILCWNASWGEDTLTSFGKYAGSEEAKYLATLANENPPKLVTHDKVGNRIDCVEFHPAYHELMKEGVKHRVPNYDHEFIHRSGSTVIRCSLSYMCYQLEQGINCPLTMTSSAIPTIKNHASNDIQTKWLPKLLSNEYDPRNVPIEEKKGVTMGMSMTEKQGGSDVRSNTTKAIPLNSSNEEDGYLINGHKWFTSAPMCDGFLTLAYTSNGLSCFLIPRWLPDGKRNEGFQIQRLKDKLGDKSNASSEIEYRDAWGLLIGKEGKGVNAIIDMVTHTRLDCSIGSAGLIRSAVFSAVNHATQRKAFGKNLIDQQLMRNVLCDLIIEAEVSTILSFYTASLFEHNLEEEKLPLKRLVTAISKYWNCKRAPTVIYEAMECHGGNGYVENSTNLPRLYRQAPLNSIWEGSGNVICLDILRTIQRESNSLPMLMEELKKCMGMDPAYDKLIETLNKSLQNTTDYEWDGRRLADSMAVALQAFVLLHYDMNENATKAFISSRLQKDYGMNLGSLNLSKTSSIDLLDRMIS